MAAMIVFLICSELEEELQQINIDDEAVKNLWALFFRRDELRLVRNIA